MEQGLSAAIAIRCRFESVLFYLEIQSYAITPLPRLSQSSFCLALSVWTSEGNLDAEQRHELGHQLWVAWPGCAGHKVAIGEAAVDRVRLQPGPATEQHVQLHGWVCGALLPLCVDRPTKGASAHVSRPKLSDVPRKPDTTFASITPRTNEDHPTAADRRGSQPLICTDYHPSWTVTAEN